MSRPKSINIFRRKNVCREPQGWGVADGNGVARRKVCCAGQGKMPTDPEISKIVGKIPCGEYRERFTPWVCRTRQYALGAGRPETRDRRRTRMVGSEFNSISQESWRADEVELQSFITAGRARVRGRRRRTNVVATRWPGTDPGQAESDRRQLGITNRCCNSPTEAGTQTRGGQRRPPPVPPRRRGWHSDVRTPNVARPSSLVVSREREGLLVLTILAEQAKPQNSRSKPCDKRPSSAVR